MPAPPLEELLSTTEEFLSRMEREIEEGKHSNIPGFRRLGGVIMGRLPGSAVITVVGDIHGDAETFHRILTGSGDSDLRVLLGDYVDRGPAEGQVTVIYTLMKRYLKGEPLVILRGNHEPPRNLVPYPHDFPMALRSLYGVEAGRAYDLLSRVWDLLPYALVIKGKLLCMHGGPPTIRLGDPLKRYLGIEDPDEAILEEILWNDPTEDDVIRLPNPRGAGSLWGKKVTRIALEKTGADMIVRGHEATLKGYKWNHEGRVLTLLSRLGAPYYNERAAYLQCRLSEIRPGGEECIVTLD